MKFIDSIKKHKKSILKILALLAVILALSLILFILLFVFNVLKFEVIDGSNQLIFNYDLFLNLINNWWFLILFIGLQVVITSFLSFIPATSMCFIIASTLMFKDVYPTYIIFLICYVGVVLSSVMMDLIGRFGGSKLITKLIGEDEYNEAHKLVTEKGTVYIPFMYLLPLFPDDAICMVCGSMKINFLLHLLFIILCRGIGVATIVFGIDIIPFESFTSVWHWIIFIAICIVGVILILLFCKWLNKKLESWRQKKNG